MASRPTSIRARVLLVEDDRSNRYAMARLLESFGMDVLEAHSIQAAIDQLSSLPDFLVLDWLMSGEDSSIVIDQARAKTPQTQIVVVTVAHDRCDEIRRHAPNTIFTKPFNALSLLEWFTENTSAAEKN